MRSFDVHARAPEALAVGISALFGAIVLILFFVPIPAANDKDFNVLAMALVAQFSAIVGYYFGSSHLRQPPAAKSSDSTEQKP